MRRLLWIAPLIAAGGAGLVVLPQQPASAPREIHLATSAVAMSKDDFSVRADVIVIARPTQEQSQHWNSTRNEEWVAPDDSGIIPMIVTDAVFAVERTLVGDHADSVTVRLVGGTVGDIRMTLDGMPNLSSGARIVLFLEEVQWPTAEGFDTVLAPIGEGQGIFVESGLTWTNAAGLSIAPAEFAREKP